MKKEAASRRKSGSSNAKVSNSKVKFPGMSKNGWELPVFVISIVVVALAAIMVSKAPIYGLSGNVISGGAITGYAFQNYQDCLSQTSGMGAQSVPYCQNLFPGAASSTSASSSSAVSGSGAYSYQFFDSGLGKIIKIFIGNPASAQSAVQSSPLGAGPLGAAGPLIVYIAIWAILFMSFSYVFINFLFTQDKLQWVSWVVGLGLAAIVSNFGLITTIVQWAAAITATLGAASVFVSMGVAFVAFFLVTFFGNMFKIHNARREAKEAEAGAIRASAGIKGLKQAAKAFEERVKGA